MDHLQVAVGLVWAGAAPLQGMSLGRQKHPAVQQLAEPKNWQQLLDFSHWSLPGSGEPKAGTSWHCLVPSLIPPCHIYSRGAPTMIPWLCLLPALISGTGPSWSAQMEASLESRVGRGTQWDERHLAGTRRGSMTETQDQQEPYLALSQPMHRSAMATEPYGPDRACPARGTGTCHTPQPHPSSWHGHTEPGHLDVAGNPLRHRHGPCLSAGREQRAPAW